MGLIKPPNILTFFIAFALVAVGVVAKMGFEMPFIGTEPFVPMIAANVLFILGCLTRGF